MNSKYKKGDSVRLVPKVQLLEILKKNNSLPSATRENIAKNIGGTVGMIHSTEEDNDNHFHFKKENDYTYSLPYEAIEAVQ